MNSVSLTFEPARSLTVALRTRSGVARRAVATPRPSDVRMVDTC